MAPKRKAFAPSTTLRNTPFDWKKMLGEKKNALVSCKACEQLISKNSSGCPNCGEPRTNIWRTFLSVGKFYFLALIVLAVLMPSIIYLMDSVYGQNTKNSDWRVGFVDGIAAGSALAGPNSKNIKFKKGELSSTGIKIIHEIDNSVTIGEPQKQMIKTTIANQYCSGDFLKLVEMRATDITLVYLHRGTEISFTASKAECDKHLESLITPRR